jgi:hypothetical protein
LRQLLDHLQNADELPFTAKFGMKGIAEKTIIEELINENQEWLALAESTIKAWIGKVQNVSLEVFRSSNRTPVNFFEAFAKIGGKGVVTASSEEQDQMMKSLLSIGKFVSESIEATKSKIHENRVAKKKIAAKRNLEEIAESSGEITIKKKHKQSYEDDIDDEDQYDVETVIDEEISKQRPAKKKSTDDDTEYDDDDLADDYKVKSLFGGILKIIASKKLETDPAITLAIETAKTTQAIEKTKQMQLELKIAELNSK